MLGALPGEDRVIRYVIQNEDPANLLGIKRTATDREIKATLVKGAAQVLGGSLVLDRATVIALGEELEVVLMELGREWPNSEFRGLLSAMAVLADSE